MGRLINISGLRFGGWLVIGKNPEEQSPERKRATYWLCRCDCGSVRPVEASSLRDGQSLNCGCEYRGRSHNASGTPEFNSWNSMHQRCKSKAEYIGVTIAERWCGSPQGFFNFREDMGPRPVGTSLDRIDNLKGYSPENCRWSTPLAQTLNRSYTRVVMLDGKPTSLQLATDIMRREIRAGESSFSIIRTATVAPKPL